MIDPLISLAFSLQASKGVYAILLGSGVSRAASIPTGWEVVLNLIERVAVAQGEETGEAPAAWYTARYGKEPDYSDLLNQLTQTPEERRALLSSYFEASDEQLQAGERQPTKAHQAIARLVKSGHIRVIVTTNFDRLMEQALAEIGIAPTVLSTADQIQGAVPLAHQRCCIVKIHGDYLDPRIKNTPAELAKYDAHTDRLLDQILDEYGLIVSGWSGDSDTALRQAIERAPNRRFGSYWTTRSDLKGAMKSLVSGRAGSVVKIGSADEFFAQLADKVDAIEAMNSTHPLSAAVAEATTKRMLASESRFIEFEDMLTAETTNVLSRVTPQLDSLLNKKSSAEVFVPVMNSVVSACQVLVAICTVVARWGTAKHRNAVVRSVERLAADPMEGMSGTTLVYQLRAIPVAYVTFATGVAAVASRNYELLIAVLSKSILSEKRSDPLALHIPWDSMGKFFNLVPGFERKFLALNEWMYSNLGGPLKSLALTAREYDDAFTRFEIVKAIVAREGLYGPKHWKESDPRGVQSGRFLYRHFGHLSADERSPLNDLEETAEFRKAAIVEGLFGGDLAAIGPAMKLMRAACLKAGQKFW